MKSRMVCAAIVAVMFLLPHMAFAGDVVVFVNKGVSVTSLSKDDMEKIFLGKKTTWDDGTKIVIVASGDSETHTAFLKTYVGKTPAQFDNLWKKKLFSGKGKPPKSFNDQQALVDFVAQTSGAIGYGPSGTDVANVKVITAN